MLLLSLDGPAEPRSLSELDMLAIQRSMLPLSALETLEEAYPTSIDLGEGRGRADVR